jgi:hypothetical protein
MARSLKQDWSYERLFCHAGSLAGIVNRLKQIANADSTLQSERNCLLEAVGLIQMVNTKLDKELSWKHFQARRG